MVCLFEFETVPEIFSNESLRLQARLLSPPAWQDLPMPNKKNIYIYLIHDSPLTVSHILMPMPWLRERKGRRATTLPRFTSPAPILILGMLGWRALISPLPPFHKTFRYRWAAPSLSIRFGVRHRMLTSILQLRRHRRGELQQNWQWERPFFFSRSSFSHDPQLLELIKMLLILYISKYPG